MSEENKLLNEHIYPVIPTAPDHEALEDMVPYEDVSPIIEKNLSDARIKEIQLRRDELTKSLKHYQKILKRWKRFENVLKVSSILIVSGTTIASLVTGIGTFLSPLFVSIIAAIGTGENVISSGLVFGLTKKKRDSLKKRIAHIQEYKSKAWYLFEKIRSDNIVTLQEIAEFEKLMTEFEKGLSSLKNESDSNYQNEYQKIRESLKKKAENEVKKEVRMEAKADLKKEIKEKMLHS